MSDMTYVYIIGHCMPGGHEGPVKIGITRSLGSRLASIQTGNWRRIDIVHSFFFMHRRVAEEVEREFHESFSESRMCGEWFGIEPFDALEGLCNAIFSVLDDHYDGNELERQHIHSGLREKFRLVNEFYDMAPR